MDLKKINSFKGYNLQDIKDKVIGLYDYKFEIENNFENKKFNFGKLKKEEYKDALCDYLETNGYGYAYKHIVEFENSDDIDIGYYLFTSGLIDNINIEMIMNSLDKYKVSDRKYKITYKETDGLNLNIRILYRTNIPIKIHTLDIGQNDFLNYKIQNDSISLNINIEDNVKINSTEKIIIYRSYGIDTFELNIECQENKKKYKDLYDFDEYLLLCKEYKEKALDIYNGKEFSKWLKNTEYVQFINYNKANRLSEETSDSSFDLFCEMNGIKNSEDLEMNKYGKDYIDNTIIEPIEIETTTEIDAPSDINDISIDTPGYGKQEEKIDKKNNSNIKEEVEEKGILKKFFNNIKGKFLRKRK